MRKTHMLLAGAALTLSMCGLADMAQAKAVHHASMSTRQANAKTADLNKQQLQAAQAAMQPGATDQSNVAANGMSTNPSTDVNAAAATTDQNSVPASTTGSTTNTTATGDATMSDPAADTSTDATAQAKPTAPATTTSPSMPSSTDAPDSSAPTSESTSPGQ